MTWIYGSELRILHAGGDRGSRWPGDQLLCDPWDAHLHGGSRWGRRRRRRRRLGLGGPSLRGFHSSLTLVPEVALPGRLHLCGWLEGRRRLEGGPQSRRAHQLGWPPLFATSLRGTNVSGSRMQSHLLGQNIAAGPSHHDSSSIINATYRASFPCLPGLTQLTVQYIGYTRHQRIR